MSKEQNELKNKTMKTYNFLKCMYEDEYYPTFLVDKCKHILIELCFTIETEQPKDLDNLYKITHQATDKFNDLCEEFVSNDSEIETVARDCIGEDFYFIAQTYGYTDADNEELIITRDW